MKAWLHKYREKHCGQCVLVSSILHPEVLVVSDFCNLAKKCGEVYCVTVSANRLAPGSLGILRSNFVVWRRPKGDSSAMLLSGRDQHAWHTQVMAARIRTLHCGVVHGKAWQRRAWV
jgi:hypothetical protein